MTAAGDAAALSRDHGWASKYSDRPIPLEQGAKLGPYAIVGPEPFRPIRCAARAA
jgi:hypothetical protein